MDQDAATVHHAAQRGIATSASPLPYLDVIQPSFGRHDVSNIKAHTNTAAQEAAAIISAKAFATGDHVAFAGTPDLHTAAHEAAHVVQQRGGVQLKGGLGEVGDPHERHADEVADRVVRGESAEALLDQHASGGRKCPDCGADQGNGDGCTSCGAKAPAATSGHLVQRSPAEVGSTKEPAGQRLPRSLNRTLAPASLSDDEIVVEIEAIRAWFGAQSASSKDSDALALALGHLAHELVRRRPGPSLPTTAPRPASSITPADVQRASAGMLAGVVGTGMVAPGLTPMPPPIPPPIPMPPPVPTIVPPVAPPVAPPITPPVVAPPVTATPKPLPVPPIATGILAFLVVLLWPSDSIESGTEERRKLEENQRQQRRPAPTPPVAGATGPTPSPIPPLGEGPKERRLPDQTCENHVLDAMQKAMHEVCDKIPGDSCSPKKVSPKKLARRPCSQIRVRIEAIRECLRQRMAIQDVCFGGSPDPTHAAVLSDVQSGLDACLALEAVNCAAGHPMAEL